MTPRWDLRPLLAPRSIAIVGASESPDSWAPEIERSLRHLGYDGSLYPINPKYDTVWGLPCLSSIARAAARRRPGRVRGAGAGRRADDRRLRRARRPRRSWSCRPASPRPARRAARSRRSCATSALRTKIPVLGPNVEGFVNYVDHVAPYGTTPPAEPVEGGDQRDLAVGHGRLDDEPDGVGSRASGSRIILGVGNEAVLGLGDLFAWAAADPATQVVTSYIETMRDVEGIGRGLDALLRRAQAGPDLRARGPVGGGAALDRRAHGRARRQHRAAGRVAAWARGRARRGPGHDVRGRGAAVAHAAAACAPGWRRRCSPAARARCSRRRPARRGCRCPSSRPRRSGAAARVAVVRVAEQPTRRDGPGRGRDRHVRRRAAARSRATPRSAWSRSTRSRRGCRARRRGPIRSWPRPCELQTRDRRRRSRRCP